MKMTKVFSTLDQGQGHHVAVGDVGDFISNSRVGFVAAHAPQEAARYRDQRRVTAHAGGEGVDLVGFIDGHFRHGDAGLARMTGDGLGQPQLAGIGRLGDDARADRHFRRPLRDGQRQEGATETEQRGEAEQRAEIETLCIKEAIDAEQMGDHRQRHHHGEVGGQE